MGSAADVSSQPAPPNPEAHSQLPVALHAPRPLQPEGQMTPLPAPLLDPEPRNPAAAEAMVAPPDPPPAAAAVAVAVSAGRHICTGSCCTSPVTSSA